MAQNIYIYNGKTPLHNPKTEQANQTHTPRKEPNLTESCVLLRWTILDPVTFLPGKCDLHPLCTGPYEMGILVTYKMTFPGLTS